VDDIQHIKAILSIEECNLLVDYMKETDELGLWTQTPDEFYRNRIEEIFLVRDEKVKTILHRLYYDLKSYMADDLEADAFHLVKWPLGMSLGAHYDDEFFPYRKMSVVVYLNDDFEGGETCFIHQKKLMEPRTGHAIIFPGTEPYAHFVATVTSGTRYTVAGFFTDDKTQSIYWPKIAGQSK
jgi:hypothetical protein